MLFVLTGIYAFYLLVLIMIHYSSPYDVIDINKIEIFIKNRKCDVNPNFESLFFLKYDFDYIDDRTGKICVTKDKKTSLGKVVCYLISVKKETQEGTEFRHLHFGECF